MAEITTTLLLGASSGLGVVDDSVTVEEEAPEVDSEILLDVGVEKTGEKRTSLFANLASLVQRLRKPRGGGGKPPGDRFSPAEIKAITELFDGTPEAFTAWRGLKEGWDIARFEKELGKESMVLLIREQEKATPGLLAFRWRQGIFGHNFPKIFGEAAHDYATIRTSYGLPVIAAGGRASPRTSFKVASRYVPLPFLSFRFYESPSIPILYYQFPIVIVVKWPRSLLFAPEPYIATPFRIKERWILGGVPNRFVLLQARASDIGELVQKAGGPKVFFRRLKEATGPIRDNDAVQKK